ncbi:hypothetical protein [Yeosuana sp. AK3]
MVKDKLINLISDKLSIDKIVIFEDSNLRKLSILSEYLESLNDVDKNRLKISKEGLTNNNFDDFDYEGNNVLIDITSFFENTENKKIIYKDPRGRDGLYNFQISEVFIILTIEKEFDIQISDEKWGSILTVGQVLSNLEKTK